jgi:GNAT superfamily N-acetyltransferase
MDVEARTDIEVRDTEPDRRTIEAHRGIFARCFPDAPHFSTEYLRWLYTENPAGTVVGRDAWLGDQLAATYVTVPARLSLEGRERLGLLSINTATDPNFQGRGLFTLLARSVIERAQERGFACIYGIANANSTPGFVRKLGFNLVEQLRAAVGVGHGYCADFSRAAADARLRREWTGLDIEWRAKNPANPLRSYAAGVDSTEIRAKTSTIGIEVAAVVPGRWASGPRALPRPLLFLGAVPSATRRRGLYLEVPAALRPSPLNLIYRRLQPDAPDRLGAGESLISFLDFDAF